MLKKRWKWTKQFGISFVILIIGLLMHHYWQKWREQPVINPHPQHFITVEGKVDPHLNVTLQMVYYTHNPHCVYVASWLEDIEPVIIHSLDYPITPNRKGIYQIKLPMDGLKSGYCKWHLSYADYVIKLQHSHYAQDWSHYDGTLLQFSKKMHSTKIIYTCTNTEDYTGAFYLVCYAEKSTENFLKIDKNVRNITANFRFKVQFKHKE